MRITLVGMILGLAGLLVLVAPAAPGVQDDHTGTFEEAVAHRSLDDLKSWKARHPWSLGDRLAEFLESLLAARRALDRTAVEQRGITASFLAEMLAEDPFSGWIVGVAEWDTEACARQETAELAVKELPSMIANGEGDAAWSQIEEVRGSIVPPGGWPLLEADLARCAAAYLHAGDRARARKLATELASSAEELRRGVVLAASERILGEIARLEGDVDDAARRTARAFELAKDLDSGPAAAILDSIEAFANCGIDTLIELSPSDAETLLVVVGEKGRFQRKVPLGGEALSAQLRAFGLMPSAESARTLRESLVGSDGVRLGRKLGIVTATSLELDPLEAILAGDAAAVRLARPPLGAQGEESSPPPLKRSWLVLLDDHCVAPSLGADAVRTLKNATREEIRKAVLGTTHIYVEAATLSPDTLRGLKLDIALAVLARVPEKGSLNVFHEAGVRDVFFPLREPRPDDRKFLAEVSARVAGGATVLDAIGAARAAGTGGAFASAAWVVHRRS